MCIRTTSIKSAVTVLLLGFQPLVNAEELHYYVVEDLAKPFQIEDKNLSQRGFITDVVSKIATELNLTLSTHIAPSQRVEKLLAEETFDNWIAYDSPAWNSIVLGTPLSQPLLQVTHSMAHCDNPLTPAHILKGKTVAILKQFRYPGLSKLEARGEIELRKVKTYDQGFELLDLGRVDGFAEMDTRLRYYLQSERPNAKCAQITSISSVEPPYPLYLVVNKHMNKDIRNAINEAFLNLIQDGFVDRTLASYRTAPEEPTL